MADLVDRYLDLMSVARSRFDRLEELQAQGGSALFPMELVAIHVRKIVELIAFGCLVAAENSLTRVPRDAVRQWNAAVILQRLGAREINVYPNPAELRDATREEHAAHGVRATIEGRPERRLTQDQMLSIYESTNKWLHELNPYGKLSPQSLVRDHGTRLWDDANALRAFLKRHDILIGGRGFYCTLWDKADGKTKVFPLNKVAEVGE